MINNLLTFFVSILNLRGEQFVVNYILLETCFINYRKSLQFSKTEGDTAILITYLFSGWELYNNYPTDIAD